MYKMKMFDINNKEMRERKVKLIEILLIVGGIVGGIRIDNQNTILNLVFGSFILCTMFYYIIVSNKLDSKIIYFAMYGAMFIIAICFSVIAILPLIDEGLPLIIYAAATFLCVLLVILIFGALWVGDGEPA